MAESHRERESHTLKAIQSLQDAYPFATGLLIYCLIERMLKNFIINEIDNDRSVLENKFHKKLKNIPKEHKGKLRKQIMLTVGQMKNKFDKNQKEGHDLIDFIKDIEKRRNVYMHSKDLFEPIIKGDYEERSKDQQRDTRKAVEDLKRAFDILGDKYELMIGSEENISCFQLRE